MENSAHMVSLLTFWCYGLISVSNESEYKVIVAQSMPSERKIIKPKISMDSMMTALN
jgi:hypothetical protein